MGNGGDLADVTGKLRIRKRASFWRRARWYLIGGGVLLVVGALVWLVWFSSVLVARDVSVEGTSLLTADEVTAAAQVPFGTPLIRLDTTAIRQRVESLPAADTVKVSTSWPRTVRIVVTERVPVYQRVDGSTFSWIDKTGVSFHQESKARADLVPVTTGSTDARLLADVSTVVGSWSDALAKQVKSVSAATPDTIELRLGSGAKVVWGSADRSPLKSQVVDALLKVKASVYDVSAPENPTTKG